MGLGLQVWGGGSDDHDLETVHLCSFGLLGESSRCSLFQGLGEIVWGHKIELGAFRKQNYIKLEAEQGARSKFEDFYS